MQPPRFDLNLLLVFEAVLQTKSTTLAATHLGLTQGAVSNSLNRLRSVLGDPLFVRTSDGMVPTPRALEISSPLQESIARIRVAIGQHPEFDPATSERSFRIYMTDVGQMVMLPRLLEALQVEAPHISIETVNAVAHRERDMAMSSGEVDLAVGHLSDFTGPFHCQALFREEYVCMVREDHPLVGDRISLEEFAQMRHAIYTPSGGGHALQEAAIDRALAAKRLQRTIALRAAHFLGFSRVVATTDMMTTLPSRLAQACAQLTPVRILKPPFEVPTFSVTQFWHTRFHLDPGNQWLRRLMARLHASAEPEALAKLTPETHLEPVFD